jgi:aspartate carbamoyltransferase regulatory subunit
MITATNPHLQVSAIENGTVIDHITDKSALKIIQLLHLASGGTTVTVGLNLPSKKMGSKDLIKISGHEIQVDEANRIAIFSPEASINIIRDFKIVKKFTVTLPEKIKDLLSCPNPQCITNHETICTEFIVNTKQKKVRLHCVYCEKLFDRDELQQYIT